MKIFKFKKKSNKIGLKLKDYDKNFLKKTANYNKGKESTFLTNAGIFIYCFVIFIFCISTISILFPFVASYLNINKMLASNICSAILGAVVGNLFSKKLNQGKI